MKNEYQYRPFSHVFVFQFGENLFLVDGYICRMQFDFQYSRKGYGLIMPCQCQDWNGVTLIMYSLHLSGTFLCHYMSLHILPF